MSNLTPPLDHWPRLSGTLAGPKAPDRCQSCGRFGSVDPAPASLTTAPDLLTRWREHDLFDRPERVVVVLCRECSDRLIEKHPRLYAAINFYEPVPGSTPLCLDCARRDGTACASPLALFNGGPGLAIVGPKPSQVHIYRCGEGARSGWETVYPGPSESCTGKEVAS